MNVSNAAHVGGLIGTGLYYYGEETAFRIVDCTVNREITGAKALMRLQDVLKTVL